MSSEDSLIAPPHNIECEQSVLGSLLLDSATAWDLVGDILQETDFYRHEHQIIFKAITLLAIACKTVDVITVHALLASQGEAEAVGGLAYLNDLAQSVPSPRNARQYASIVADMALRRTICAAAIEARAVAYEPGGANEVLERVAGLFAGIEQRKRVTEPVSLASALINRMDHWQDMADGKAIAGIPTRFPTMDKALSGGLKPGTLIPLAARTSVGKTSLAVQIGLNVAKQGHAALLLSQEMETGEIVDRMVANLGRVHLGEITTGKCEKDSWSRMTEAVEEAAHLPFFIDDTPALTLAAIRSKARHVQRKHGLALLIVDYLQLCAATGTQDKRHHQIEQISRGLKALAKELGITILLLSQLNRASTQRDEPQLVDLKESGAIEEDADVVILLHPKGLLPDGSHLIAAILAKNRQGKRGRVALAFHGSTQRWVESTADVSPKASGGP
jgi:replicative DNA helicase